MMGDRLWRAAHRSWFEQDPYAFLTDSSDLNHLQAHSVRRVSFPHVRRLEIVAESR